jgi:hypothetical protein
MFQMKQIKLVFQILELLVSYIVSIRATDHELASKFLFSFKS